MQGEPLNVRDFYEAAKDKLETPHFGYYSSGADSMVTLKDTREVFDSIKLKARALANADKFGGTETTILGKKISSPICIAPTAF